MRSAKDIRRSAAQRLREMFPGATGWEEVYGASVGSQRIDLVVKFKMGTAEHTLVVEEASLGQPRHIREAMTSLEAARRDTPGAYGLAVAPYISPQGAALLRKNGLGYLDLSGNCHLAFGSVLIEKECKPNARPSTRPLRSPFAPRGTRVVRVLLVDPQHAWRLEELAKVEADNKVTAEHLNEVNRSVASVAKALENAGGKFVSREDDHERRIDETTRELGHVQAQIQTLDKNLENQHAFLKQVEQHLSALRVSASQRAEQAPAVAEVAPLAQSQAMPPPEAVSPPMSSLVPSIGSMSRSENRSAALMADLESYERTLTRFKDGDLDGARQGFAEFLLQHPHSDLAPNARFWLGESYYGKKDFSRAIDAYDQVQLNHPASEKVPAALLKKGSAYLALKDRKKAASALKQVIDLYPKSPEANKAMDKLNQLKELH